MHCFAYSLYSLEKKKKTQPEILPVEEDVEKNVSLKIKFIFFFLNDKPNQ